MRPVGSRGTRFFALSIAVATAAREGFVLVKRGEEDEGPVMWRERVVFRGVVIAVSFEKARREVVLGAAIVV